MSQNPRQPSASQLFEMGDHCVTSQAGGQPSLQAQQPVQGTGLRFQRQLPSHLSKVPAPSAASRGMMGQVPPNTPVTTTAMGFTQGHSIPGNVNPNPAPVPTALHNAMHGGRPANTVPPPGSYIAELRRGNVGVNYVWHESTMAQLAELEVEVLRVTEEKGRAFWKLWVDIREPDLEIRDRDKGMRFMARQLRTYSWYRGDETVEEAMDAIRKINGICAAFMAGKRGETAHVSLSNRTMPPGVAATMFSGTDLRMGATAEIYSQAQVEEAGDAEQ